MKSFYKIITLALLMLGLFSVSSNVWAEEEKVEILYENKAELVATVNIYGAKILSQKNNIFDISFNISNGKIIQPGVKYGIQLIKKTEKGQLLIDEFVYDEVLDLPQNILLSKKISYAAPANIEGKYDLYLKSKNDKGMTFSTAFIGEVELINQKPGINILNESCYLKVLEEKDNKTYNLIQGVDILETESLVLSCLIENKTDKEINVDPMFETYYRSLYGNLVEHIAENNNSILLKANENKEISVVLPKALIPQAYDIKVNFGNEEIKSNTVFMHYVLRGESATIQNLSLDKDYYKKDEPIKISFLWSPAAHNFPDSRLPISKSDKFNIEINVLDNNNKSCIDPIKRELLQDFKDPIVSFLGISKKECLNPNVEVIITDNSGNLLDQKSFAFETQNKIFLNNKLIILIILIVIIFLFFFLLKKKREDNSLKFNLFLFFLIIFFGSIGIAKNVSADTFVIGDSSGLFYANVDVSWSNGKYFKEGEDRPVAGSMEIASCTNPVLADLYSGDIYVIKNTEAEVLQTISGNAILPSSYYGPGKHNETFIADVKNVKTDQTINGMYDLEYYIVGPAECCTSDNPYCCSSGESTDLKEDEYNYTWNCSPVNYPNEEIYPLVSCKSPKTVSCNYDYDREYLLNSVSENYYTKYLNSSEMCNAGIASNIEVNVDSYGNTITSWVCTGDDNKNVSCSVGGKGSGNPDNYLCYSEVIDQNFYDDFINDCYGKSELCKRGKISSCEVNPNEYDPNLYRYDWSCTTGDLDSYNFIHQCMLLEEGDGTGEIIPNSAECNTSRLNACIYGDLTNENSTDPSKYTWDCILGETVDHCSISKTSLIGDLTVSSCFIPYFSNKTTCDVNLDWSFFGNNLEKTQGNVYVIGESGNLISRDDQGENVPYTIDGNKTFYLTSTYSDSTSKILGKINVSSSWTNWKTLSLNIYDKEIATLTKTINKTPEPFVKMADGGSMILKKNTVGNFLIWATDEDHMDIGGKDVSFQIDWNMDNETDLKFLDSSGHFIFFPVDKEIPFSNPVDQWGNAGVYRFQVRAFDYYEPTRPSNWKTYEITIIDEDKPEGTLTASPNPCFISLNESTCPTRLTATVVNPVVGAKTNVTKSPNIQVIPEFDYTSPKTEGGVTVDYPSTTFYLNHDGIPLNPDGLIVYAECDTGLNWVGGKCIASNNTLPDLVAENLSPININIDITNGLKEVQFTADIKNDSTVKINTSFDNKFEVSEDNSFNGLDKIIYANKSIDSLDAGSKQTISQEISFGLAGKWYVWACADTNGNIKETNEGSSSNCTEIATVTVTGVLPQTEPTWNVRIWAEPPLVIDGRQSTLHWEIDRITGDTGSCMISSIEQDSSLGKEGKYQIGNLYPTKTVRPRILSPESKNQVYNYIVSCDGKITGGDYDTSINVVRLKEIEN